MKRPAVLLMSSLAAGALHGALAYGDPLGDAVPENIIVGNGNEALERVPCTCRLSPG